MGSSGINEIQQRFAQGADHVVGRLRLHGFWSFVSPPLGWDLRITQCWFCFKHQISSHSDCRSSSLRFPKKRSEFVSFNNVIVSPTNVVPSFERLCRLYK